MSREGLCDKSAGSDTTDIADNSGAQGSGHCLAKDLSPKNVSNN
jgi:hypothetical protein